MAKDEGAIPVEQIPLSENTRKHATMLMSAASGDEDSVDVFVRAIVRRLQVTPPPAPPEIPHKRRFLETAIGMLLKYAIVVVGIAATWLFAFYRKTDEKPTKAEVGAVIDDHSHSLDAHPYIQARIDKIENLSQQMSNAIIRLTTVQEGQAETLKTIHDDVRAIRRGQ